MKYLTLVALLIGQSVASMSPTFLNWLSSSYGPKFAERLNRADLGQGGSFGGGTHIPRQLTPHEPVIIVHGITNRADRFSAIRDHFIANGYTDAEVFATTYGDAGKTNVLFVNMECDFVKRIRELIIAVSAYTSSRVDILAFSMGSPIARKAIMGGICVDTGEQLGGSLTALVDTFVGVAGANFGSFLCLIPFGSCNLNNGMHCNSRFLADINSRYVRLPY
uniref:Lipase domain-containing protein n=1 Tax=Ascaris lumbricoides TaxID=6252 RepID=A0A0M3IR70_ASCLU